MHQPVERSYGFRDVYGGIFVGRTYLLEQMETAAPAVNEPAPSTNQRLSPIHLIRVCDEREYGIGPADVAFSRQLPGP